MLWILSGSFYDYNFYTLTTNFVVSKDHPKMFRKSLGKKPFSKLRIDTDYSSFMAGFMPFYQQRYNNIVASWVILNYNVILIPEKCE